MHALRVTLLLLMVSSVPGFANLPPDRSEPPNIVLVMADDQGWAQTGYYEHPVLKTPHLDAMAAAGLRFDRFYAAAPVCSPTRASVLTGRSNMRTGVDSHGFALRLQESTLPEALREAGYATGHFGKWHLNGMRGPGVPILASDTHHPGAFGFETWLSVTNFFDRDPILSREGRFESFEGDGSEIIVREALRFIGARAAAGKPSFTVIWYGSPHSPFRASPEDLAGFEALDEKSRQHHGELVALDRSVGLLRAGLRELKIEENTLVWYTSDNGGLPRISPSTVGNLRGFKGSLYEGGLRVPAILEWPGRIREGQVTRFPAVSMDIAPTVAELACLPESAFLQPQDGLSLVKLFDGTEGAGRREKPIPFHCFKTSAWLDYPHKLLRREGPGGGSRYELYDLEKDPGESDNLYDKASEVGGRLREGLETWLDSMEASVRGADYPDGKVGPGHPEPRQWTEVEAYRPHFEAWRDRPEYRSRLGDAEGKR